MNDIEYNYIAMELPNILFEQRKSDAGAATPVTNSNTQTHPFLLPLMLRLAQARPKWKFVAQRRNLPTPDGRYALTSFIVYEGGETLGRIWKSYENRGDVVNIDNPRMQEARQRGNSTSTQDLKKAFKLVTKNFHGPTLNEIVKDAIETAHNTVSVLTHRTQVDFYKKYGALSDFLVAYTMNNWDHIKQMAIDVGLSPASLDGMSEAYDAYKATRDISNTMGENKGATVLIRGDEYIVVREGATAIFDTDHLPSHIKRSVGILKMVDNQTYVEGHGARVSKDKFFVSAKEGA